MSDDWRKEHHEQMTDWLVENCGRGLPYEKATDLPSALHGLAYVLRQIEGTNSYNVHIGQSGPAASAIRWALYHFAEQALRGQEIKEGERV